MSSVSRFLGWVVFSFWWLSVFSISTTAFAFEVNGKECALLDVVLEEIYSDPIVEQYNTDECSIVDLLVKTRIENTNAYKCVMWFRPWDCELPRLVTRDIMNASNDVLITNLWDAAKDFVPNWFVIEDQADDPLLVRTTNPNTQINNTFTWRTTPTSNTNSNTNTNTSTLSTNRNNSNTGTSNSNNSNTNSNTGTSNSNTTATNLNNVWNTNNWVVTYSPWEDTGPIYEPWVSDESDFWDFIVGAITDIKIDETPVFSISNTPVSTISDVLSDYWDSAQNSADTISTNPSWESDWTESDTNSQNNSNNNSQNDSIDNTDTNSDDDSNRNPSDPTSWTWPDDIKEPVIPSVLDIIDEKIKDEIIEWQFYVYVDDTQDPKILWKIKDDLISKYGNSIESIEFMFPETRLTDDIIVKYNANTLKLKEIVEYLDDNKIYLNNGVPEVSVSPDLYFGHDDDNDLEQVAYVPTSFWSADDMDWDDVNETESTTFIWWLIENLFGSSKKESNNILNADKSNLTYDSDIWNNGSRDWVLNSWWNTNSVDDSSNDTLLWWLLGSIIDPVRNLFANDSANTSSNNVKDWSPVWWILGSIINPIKNLFSPDMSTEWKWITIQDFEWLPQRHLDSVWYAEIHQCLKKGAPIKVAIVDNGFDLLHLDLDDKIVAMYDEADDDDDVQVPNYKPERNHGTKEAWLVWAEHNDFGVRWIYPYAELILVKATKDTKSGRDITNGIEAVAKAYELGADVINLSRWGYANVPMLEKVTKKISEKWVYIVAAAWNYNKSEPFYPAAYDWVIWVAAVDHDGAKANFSNYGPWVDISAPWVDMLTTDLDNMYEEYHGTSEASPVVAWALALALSYWLTRDDILDNTFELRNKDLWAWILDMRFICDMIPDTLPDYEEHGSSKGLFWDIDMWTMIMIIWGLLIAMWIIGWGINFVSSRRKKTKIV